MSIRQRMRVPFDNLFPAGPYLVGEIEPVEDYELTKAAKAASRSAPHGQYPGSSIWREHA